MKRIRFKRQHDSMLCGVACLEMVCRFHGVNFDKGLVECLCTPANGGVSLRCIHEAAEALGFKVSCGFADIEGLEDGLPCILHWNQNHFVVLHKVGKGNFHVADPAKGMMVYVKDDFERHWLCDGKDGKRGVVMFLHPMGGKPSNGESKDVWNSYRSFDFLYGYFGKYRKTFYTVMLLMLVCSLLQAALPFLTQSIVDKGISNKDIGFIWVVLAGQLTITISRTLADFVQRRLLLSVSNRVNISLVSDFLTKLFRLPMEFFDTKNTGDILQRVNDHSRINNFLTRQALGATFAVLTFAVFATVLFLYSRIIFAILAIGSLTYGLWTSLLLKRRRRLDYEIFDLRAQNTNRTFQMVTSMQEIKLQGCETRRRDEWTDTQEQLMVYQMRSLKLQQCQEAGGVAINEIKNIVITICAATSVIHGDITLGAMLSVQFIIGQLNAPIEQLVSFIYSLQDVGISMERINEVASKGDEDGRDGLLEKFANVCDGIVLQRVCFKYDKFSPTFVLDDVSLDIPHGSVTAIVGSSGSGKTTLLKLLLGYYAIHTGRVRVCGEDIGNYSMGWWRSQCGVVMQDGVIFSDTIAGNIGVNGEEIDMERMREAADIACLAEFVESLPLGYYTKVGADGVGLSQGQRQRILIARTVYRDPQFIFLDEATNALDANNERKIVERLEKFFKGRTVVIVAHRLSTVRNADQIIVLDKGRIAEIGTHLQLVERHGAYYKLVKNQLELGN